MIRRDERSALKTASSTCPAASASRSPATSSRSTTAKDADQADTELEAFDEKWGARFPVIAQAWLNAWEHVIPFLAFPEEVRRVIYATNAIEALNRQLCKAIKTKDSFPTEDAARKLVYFSLQNAVPQWTRTRNWTTALLAFEIHFGDRVPDTAN